MEQPPGSIDDLQPQDLSASGIPTVIDLTRKGDECVLNSTPVNALRVAKSPGCFPNSGTSQPGLHVSETGSTDVALPSGDQIQPDNAFSHTTVTLSYVSRSHVFSTHDSLSQHSAPHGVPPISSFNLHPSCDADKGLGATGYKLKQPYLEQAEGPVDLATQTEQLQFQAQVGPENDVRGCVTQKPHECNGAISWEEDVEKPLQGEEERSHTMDNRGLENGQGENCSLACAESSPETVTHVTGGDKEGSEVLFLMSKKQDSAVIRSDGAGCRDLRSLSREYISPLEDPVSPSATSLEDVEDVYLLPQASCSPSADNSSLETAEEVACDGLNTEGAIQPSPGVSDGTSKSDLSDGNKQPAHRRKAVLEPLLDLTEDVCVSGVVENKPKTVVPHMNGNAKVLERTLEEKKLPMRLGRGTRLEAIVMNINSSRYKVSGCIRSNKNAKGSQSAASDSALASLKSNDAVSVGKRKGREKTSFSVKTQKVVTPVKRGKTINVNTDSCKDSTSDCEINNSKKSNSSTPPKSPQFTMHKRSKRKAVDTSHHVHPPQLSPVKSNGKRSSQSRPQVPVHKNSKKEPELPSQPDPSVESCTETFTPAPSPSKSPKKSQGTAKSKSPASKTSPAAKTKAARSTKRRRKKHRQAQSSSMFAPKEPEIKLRYVNFKEEKRDSKLDSFSPFIRVERHQSSPLLCTVINYPEDVGTQHKKGQQQQAHSSGFLSAVIPSTSCLQLGRVSTHSQHQRSLVCCLCGEAANAMDLGDLHGPYYPEGYRITTKTPTSTSGLKEDEDDYSDTDSSSCSVRGRGRKCAVTPRPWAVRPGAQLKQVTGDNTSSPAAKRARSDAGCADAEDWYSPPVLPLEPCEYWLHEDCSIWSAGVFLVKGKVYGLEEAVKVAQETICSACHNPGATLGCFFKGCPNKYHYKCALESDCILIEENFSMKCKKHKNKTFKAPPGNRSEDR
ncbi:retinoic acid-induced protein 1 isoform X2 [Mugil cephalus]|uniref:retinoic acid-induced protein 1 isoform X2 n=1 Tax=Mugil cephalus TaxID=48193 RepID=UPI001FB63341|nr:retinoic acid-induced protein 1 isoform X2 [Mugil cephalus]